MSLGLQLVVLVAVFIQYSECVPTRRFNYDARLFEHFAHDSHFIQYSRTNPDDWKNISALAESRHFTFTSMICTIGPGAWIFYPGTNYSMGNEMIYYLVVGEHCVRANDIESIQPLGKMDELLEQGVLLFEEPQFGSPQTLVTEGDGSGEGGSLIFTGGQSFLLENGNQKICLRPGLTIFEDGYCLIPNLKSSFNIDGTVTVKENCTEDDPNTDEKKLVVQNCYMEGVHEIYGDQDLSIDKLTEVCNGGGDNFLKSKFTIVMEMWKKRMGGVLATSPEKLDKDMELRMGILWRVLEIFKDTCDIVEDTYIYILGHLFSYHLKHVWKTVQPRKMIVPISDKWNETVDIFEFCIENMDSGKVPKYQGSCKGSDEFDRLAEDGSEPKPIKGEFTETDASWYEIVNGEMFDPVIEQMWLVINVVLPMCSLTSEYINNDWTDLVVLFHKNYLDPLQDIWSDPGDWRRVYNAVFHGYDMREVHKDILACLRGVLEAAPAYDPIGRPQAFRDYMVYKYQTPAPGKLEIAEETRRKRGK